MIAESFERIHRSNLVGMGILPLQHIDGQNSSTLGLSGKEEYSICLDSSLAPRKIVQVKVRALYCLTYDYTSI